MHNISIQEVVKRRQERKDDFQERACNWMAHLIVWMNAMRQRGIGLPVRDEPGQWAWSNALDVLYLKDVYRPVEAKYAKFGDREGLWFRWDKHWTGRGDDSGARMFFYNIRPRPVGKDDISYGTPDLVDSEVISQVAISEKNRTYDSIPWTPSFADRRESEDTDTKQLGTNISIGLRQLVSYGGELYGGKGETELTTSVQQSINLGEQRRKLFRSDIDSVVDIKVPPFTQLFRTRTVKEGTYKQRITTTAAIDFGVAIDSDRDFHLEYDSRDDAILALTGSAIDNGHNWADYYRNHTISDLQGVADPFEIINQFLAPMYGTIDTEIEIKGALDYDYDTRSEELAIPEDAQAG